MFKDDYRKQFEDVAPSPALEKETLELMAEAQAHGFIAPPVKSKKPLILSLSLSGAAAMLAVTVGLSFWFNRPDTVEPDKMGNLNSVISGNSSKPADKEELPPADDEEIKGDPTPESDGSTDSSSNSAPEAGQSAGSNAAPGTEGGDDAVEEQPENTAPTPVSPLGPVEINDKNTQTYLSIQAYLDAMVAKKTIGYGKNYIADPALVIVPSWLPQQTQFRHLYAKSNGAYSYSYLVTDGENQYFLEIAAPATFPRTLRDLNLRVRAVKGEYEGMDKLENKRIYYFGNYEEITVTLTTVNGAAPTLEETDRILADFQLDRYTTQNTLVQMEYKS